MEYTPEFFKLDATDRKVLFWMMDSNPQSLKAWIEYVTQHYGRTKSVTINPDKLFEEVIIELPAGENQASWRPKKILLVDDDSLFNFLHKRMLELTGASEEIQIALNGNQAIQMLKSSLSENNVPDVIILDLSMPVMDGFGFLEAFEQMQHPRKGEIAIIVITSSIDARDRERARKLGIAHYLIKPVDELELCSVVIGSQSN